MERLKGERQRRAETKERRTIIKRLKKVSKKLKKMPSEFAAPIKEFLDSINLVSLSQAKREELLAIKDELERGKLAPENVLSPQELKQLERLGRSDAKDFTIDELRQINDAIMHYVKLASDFNQIRIAQRKLEMEEALAAIESELKPAKEVEGDLIRTQKGRIEKGIEGAGKIIDIFWHFQKAPDALLESMAGRDSVIYQILFKQVNQGAKAALAYRQKAQDLLAEGWEGFAKRNNIGNIMKWLNEKVTIELGGGKAIEMTRMERMSFYRHSLNPDNRRALIESGAGFRSSADFKNKPFVLDENTLQRIIDSMTPAELDFAGETVTEMFDEQGRLMAEVYKKKAGIDLETLENYFPKDVLPREREAGDTDIEFDAEKFRGKFLRIGIEKGMTKARIGSKKAIYITGLMEEINRSINRAASYIGLEIPLSNAARLYYNKDFQNMIDDRYGEKVRKYIEKYLRDVAGEMKNYDAVESMLGDVKNNLSVAYLAISPFIMAKQAASLPLYSVYIEPKYLIEGIMSTTMHPIETKERHKATSPYYRARLGGASERDVADVFKSKALRKLIPDSRKTLKEWGMTGIQMFDLAAVTPGMEAGVLKVMDEFEKGKLSDITKETLNITDEDIASLTPAERIEKAYEFAEWVTEKTQPQFAPQFRSELSRGGMISRFMTMFGSFTNRAYNLLGSTYANARRTGKASDWAIFGRAAFNIMVINTTLILAINYLRDEMYDREPEDLWRNLLKNWSGYIFILRDVVNAAITEGYYAAQFEVPIQSWFQESIDSMRSMIKYLEDGDEKDLNRALDKGASFVLTAAGVPYPFLKKTIAPKKKKGRRR
jgi:hypothetical protein